MLKTLAPKGGGDRLSLILAHSGAASTNLYETLETKCRQMFNDETQSRRGGARPNSGPKVDIAKNLILYDIAISLGVGLDRARRLLTQ